MSAKPYACIDCGKTRLVKFIHGQPCTLRCISCAKIKRMRPLLPLDYLPEENEIRLGYEIGKKRKARWNQYKWFKCPNCKKPRWVSQNKNPKYCINCVSFKGDKSSGWKGGKSLHNGYVLVTLINPGEFWYSMSDKRHHRIPEHRLIMAKHLGRLLQPWELVHHKNGIKDDNRIENLELTTNGTHTIAHSKGYKDGYAKGLIDGRNTQIEELKKEIRLLRWELSEEKKVG